jgi:hypothetical protein
MRRLKWLILVVFAGVATARLPIAAADTESAVTCKDGTTSKGGKGACSHHGGVAGGATSAPAPSSAPPAAKPSSPAPAPAPTVKCKDGSESKGGKGACSHHGGVAAGDMGGSAPPAGAPPPPPSAQGRSAPATPRPTSSGAPAQPGQATAKCKDGAMSYSAHHSGACSHHGGVAQWLQ